MKNNRAKKIILSAAVVSLFAVYSIYQQVHTRNALNSAPIVAQQNLNGTNTNTSASAASASTSTSTQAPASNAMFKDGTYTGNPADAVYGTVQVQAVISGGKLTDVKFLQYPSDRSTSVSINQQAMSALIQEAVSSQGGQINTVSGATATSGAFVNSLNSALIQAKI